MKKQVNKAPNESFTAAIFHKVILGSFYQIESYSFTQWLIMFSADPDNTVKKEWIINPNDKSYICILHRYLQQILKAQPQYEFKELGKFH